jgi:tRNA-uridine 2-sulfurtransferase
MGREAFERFLYDSSRRGPEPPGSHSGAAGGAPCGDLVRISVRAEAGRIVEASFDAEGCGAALAAAAATAELAESSTVIEAAAIGPDAIEAALGGLSPLKRHAPILAADALHRALASLAASGEPLAAERKPARVLVAMSGGVDSAVAALLERRRGADVVAVTLKLWSDARTDGAKSCCSPRAVLDARALAHSMAIPHLTLDLEKEFRSSVVDDFLAGYASGTTPNPCVRCNGLVRIEAMVGLADRLGAGHLATGHYARLVSDDEGPLLAAAADQAKDQTYMLSAVEPALLARLRFPLSELRKDEVRAVAAEAGLAVATKRDSQDLCFLAGEGKRSFLHRQAGLRERPGDLVDPEGRKVGRHRGHHNFTVGQRRGVGVAAPQPLYVLATDAMTNTVTVGERRRLAVDRVRLRDVVLHRDGARVERVKLRYGSNALPCRLGPGAGPGRHAELTVWLEEAALGVAPGQSACLLDGELVVGQGTIGLAAGPEFDARARA